MDSTTSPSSPRAARATPTTSTSPGRSGPTASSCRCSPRRWTASSRRRPPGIIGKLGGLAVLNLEGIWTRYEDADEQLERIAGAPNGRGHARDAGDLPGAGQGRADRAAHRGDQGARRRRRRLAHSAARRALPRARARRRARHPRHPGHGRSRPSTSPVAGPRAQPQGVRPRAAGPGRARRLRLLLDRACTSCAPARPACSSASAPARRAPRAACSASASRRRRRSPTSRPPARSTCSRPASTAA